MPNNTKHTKNKTFVLLDTHGLIHRAFHALPPLTSPAGEPVGAVYGVATMLFKILKEFQPDHLAAAFDRPEQTFRHKAYKEYKATRPEAAPDLIKQFTVVHTMFEAFGVRIYDSPGYEADDVIGTLVAKARKADKNLKIVIASGDLDIIQLVDGTRTMVYTMRKGMADTVLYDENAVRERFGFPPVNLPDFKGLKGDPSDNIKGVPGVGDKSATVLIQKFGTLEKLYAALTKKGRDRAIFKGKLPEVLQEHKDGAFFSRDLACIRQNVPIGFNLSDTTWNGIPDKEDARNFLEQKGFTSLLSRLPFAEKQEVVSPTEGLQYGEEQNGQDIFGVSPKHISADFFSLAIKIKHVSWMMTGDGKAVRAAVSDTLWLLQSSDLSRYKKEFERLFVDAVFHTAFGAKDVLKFFWKGECISCRIDFDVGIAAWLLDPTIRVPDITDLLGEKLHVRPAMEATAARLAQLAAVLQKELEKNETQKVFFEIEMPLIPMLAYMEKCGILLDKKALADFSQKLSLRMSERETQIYKLAGAEFNINSPKQLSDILFEKLGISQDAVRKTGGGVRSTRASELAKLRGAHPLVNEILLWREEMKLKSTYVDVLPQLADLVTGRIYTTFNQTGTVTGRLSSQNPNMQNIPIRTPLGQEIRRAFIASPGYVLLSCDYSQIELRIAAHMSGDERMARAFHDNKDIHTLTAAAVHHVLPEKVTPIMRRAAKVINFGILYGMGAQSLSESLGISHREASLFIRAYFAEFPRVKELIEQLKKQATERGYVETLFGRRRYFQRMADMGWQARREAERMAVNAPIQGSDSDIVKTAMVRVFQQLQKEIQKDILRPLLQVHDELLFEVQKETCASLRKKIQTIMENACTLSVPLKVDMREGANWLDVV